MRHTPVDLADGTKLVVTVHPSALLRIEDDNDKRAAYRDFVADLKAARMARVNMASGKLASGKAAAPKR
jgi:uracil-DNA glycosylase